MTVGTESDRGVTVGTESDRRDRAFRVPTPGSDMSTAMNFSNKSFTPRPPDKGAFPLDHFGECSAFKERFMECLRQSGYESAACRQSAMAYLECRMDRQLMANEPLEKLGFKDLINEKSEEKPEKS